MSTLDTLDTITHFINGAKQETASGRYADVYNPALGEPVARVALASIEDVDTAVRAAEAAFPSWSATPPLTRARVLFKYLQLCQQHVDEFAAVVTLEHGKTFADALASKMPYRAGRWPPSVCSRCWLAQR